LWIDIQFMQIGRAIDLAGDGKGYRLIGCGHGHPNFALGQIVFECGEWHWITVSQIGIANVAKELRSRVLDGTHLFEFSAPRWADGVGGHCGDGCTVNGFWERIERILALQNPFHELQM
jgi:hypothetical protein